jgi:hypothetical protein
MNNEDDESVDDYLETANSRLREGLRSGVQYIHALHRCCNEDEELYSYRRKMDEFFKKLLAFAEKKNANMSKIRTIDDLGAFGFAVEDEVCYAALLRIIADNDTNQEDSGNYELDDFEDFDEDGKEEQSPDDDMRFFAQNKGDLAVEDYTDDHGFKTPAPSSEPKIIPGNAKNEYKFQPVADTKQSNFSLNKPGPQSKELPPSMRSSAGGRRRNPTWISERRWTLSDQIGEGAFGQVFKCLDDMV